jgi:ATP-dependent Clp protease ATP-binding subunit ClpC
MEDLDALHQVNKDKVHDVLKKMMRPELLNRIDKTIVFRALTKKDIMHILDLQIEELRGRLVKHGLGLQLTQSAKDYMLKHGYDAHNGVRPLRRLIQETLEDHLSLALLNETYHKGDVIKVAIKNNELSYDRQRETTPAKAQKSKTKAK